MTSVLQPSRLLSSLIFFAPLLLALLLPNRCIYAGEPVPLAPGKGRAIVYGGWLGSDHYQDIYGNLKRFDTVGTSFNAIIFGLSADYGLIDGLEANIELPLGYFSLTSNTRFPKRSIFAPAYLGLGATYGLLGGSYPISVSGMIRIPPGFHNGIYNDSLHPSFLSDGFLQGSLGVNLGYSGNGVWVKATAAYNWRAEEPVDEIHLGGTIGFSKIEGTGILLGVKGVIPTEDVTRPARPFYAGASGNTEQRQQADGGTGRFLTIDREAYIAFEAGAYVNITSQFFLTGNYTIRLGGRNTLILAGGFLGVGYQW